MTQEKFFSEWFGLTFYLHILEEYVIVMKSF